jgi:peptidylprolyl isomerase
MNYVGVAYSTKKEFDNSYDRGQPFDVTLGEGAVIAGWDEGIVGMKVGGRRELIIPPDMGYGARGGPGIKPNETLVFVVDLVSIN